MHPDPSYTQQVEQLTEEIIAVYRSVSALKPNILTKLEENRTDDNNPRWPKKISWFPVTIEGSKKKKKTVTVRDLILKKYIPDYLKKDTVVTCRLSFEISSDPSSFHIDHFEPKDHLIGRIDALEKHTAMLEILRHNLEGPLGINVAHALISEEKVFQRKKKTIRKFNLMGLKQIYVNCPLNLWPVSGSSNTSKSALDSLTSVVPRVVESLKKHLHSDAVIPIVPEHSDLLAASIDQAFQARCESQHIELQYSILPLFFDEDSGGAITLLHFFEQTPLGRIADVYADTMRRLGTGALYAVRHAIKKGSSTDPESKAHAKKITSIIKLARHTARDQEREDAEERSGSPYASSSDMNTEELNAVQETLEEKRRHYAANKNKKQALPTHDLLDRSSASQPRKKQKTAHLNDQINKTLRKQNTREPLHMNAQLSLFGSNDPSTSLGLNAEEAPKKKNIFEHEHPDTEVMADDEHSEDTSEYSEFDDKDLCQGP